MATITNSSIATDADDTNSTIYRLFESEGDLTTRTQDDSVNSVSVESNDGDSLTVEDFNGFTAGDLETDHSSDPFEGIFYHMMTLHDTTTIMFYNKPIFNNILAVLNKQYTFPAVTGRTFQLKTHVDKNKCILKIDRTLTTICATGPGHTSWKDKCFRMLAESIFRTYVDHTNSMLDSNRVNDTLSTSQDSTQNPENNELVINETVEEPEAETPTGSVAQQPEQVVLTQLRDSLVLRKISILMDMISTMQKEMSKLTNEVNDLAGQHVANQTLYRTVDETNTSSPSLTQFVDNEVSQHQGVQEEVPISSEARTPNMSNSNLPSPNIQLPDPQTRPYNEVLRTSTPRDSTNETPHRPRTAQGIDPTPKSAQRVTHNNNSDQILLIGDSLISKVNPKGLAPNVIKNGISGGNIDKISSQIKVYDIRKFSHVIIYVGGNDASSGTDVEYFEEKFDQVIQHIKESNNQCKIVLCTSCPRGDTCVSEVNNIIQSLTQDHGIGLIDQNKAFHNKHGNIITGYYESDSIHPSTSGVKRLVGTINQEVTIVNDFTKCAYGRSYGKKLLQSRPQYQQNRPQPRRNRPQPQWNRPQPQQIRQQQQPNAGGNRSTHDRQNDDNYNQCEINLCYKCGESNHDTKSCRHKNQLKCFHCGFLGHKSGRCLQYE